MLAFPDFGNVLATHCIDSEANPMIRDFFEGLFTYEEKYEYHIRNPLGIHFIKEENLEVVETVCYFMHLSWVAIV